MTGAHTGVYRGRIKRLQGERALLRPSTSQDMVRAQFDNLKLGLRYTLAWITFKCTDFIPVEEQGARNK